MYLAKDDTRIASKLASEIIEKYWSCDGLRSGEGKLADEKAKNVGVLAADSYVCKQLLDAKNFAKQLGDYDANGLMATYPYTYNLGIGPQLPNNAFGVVQIGNTRFYNRPFR